MATHLGEALQKAGTCDGYGFQMHHEIRPPGYPAIEKAFRRIAEPKAGTERREGWHSLCIRQAVCRRTSCLHHDVA